MCVNMSRRIVIQGYTTQVATLTVKLNRFTGNTVQRRVLFQGQGQRNQPKDTEGQQRMHGSFVQATRNFSFIVSLTVSHTWVKTVSGIYDVMRSLLTEEHGPLYWPLSAGCPWWDRWHRPKKQSQGGLKEREKRLDGYHNQLAKTWQTKNMGYVYQNTQQQKMVPGKTLNTRFKKQSERNKSNNNDKKNRLMARKGRVS